MHIFNPYRFPTAGGVPDFGGNYQGFLGSWGFLFIELVL